MVPILTCNNIIDYRNVGFNGNDEDLDAFLQEINEAHGFLDDDNDLKLTRQNFGSDEEMRFFQKLLQNR